MVIPSYAYLKLKIPGPARVITMEAKAQQALNYKQESIELAVAMVAEAELRELSVQTPVASSSLAMPPSFSTFKATNDAKAVQINSENPTKTIQIGAGLNPK
jgi:hypothetical protein